ncbi:RNA polymerase sigma factor [Actomonas aquatica]|uniref:RNA polymerase sigma factor n=1 Tax=Actomonas aquatica TaxID=2866162 RepID=A0ABZ1CBC4_9BACT|nr:RNA polymerase sigma factor [Opitutus sp. WL0086]WRQ88712.1 RNA polymerase sigma factor [Opitutus sp. WL0086]
MTTDLDIEAIAEEHYVPLFRFAASLTRESHTASDLTQQAFLALARNSHAVRDRSRVKSWLHTTVYREFLHNRTRQNRWTDTENMPETADHSAVPGTGFGRDEKEAVRKGIDSLEPMYRDTLRLRYLQGMDYRSIAKHLNIPIGTVMSRLSRAHRRLASYIQDSASEVLTTCLAR